MKKLLLAMAILLVVAALAACGSPEGGGPPAETGPASAPPVPAPTAVSQPLPQRGMPAVGTRIASTPPFPTATASPYLPTQQVGMWVSGEGKVAYTPDLVLLSLGIEVREKTVAQAQSQAAQAMDRVVAALKANGIAEKDIHTTSFSIRPVYEWIERTRQQQLIGYQVSNQVQAKLRQVDRAGEVIDAVAEAGGDLTRINNIAFSIDNPAPLQSQAREQAIKAAMAKAEQMARVAGIKLGRVLYISESATPTLPPPRPFAMMEAGKAAPATPILPGEMEIRVTVQMVYALE